MRDKIKQLTSNLLKSEAIMYVVFGILTTIINIICYGILKQIGMNYIISNLGAFVISVIFAFITNKVYVFKSQGWSIVEVSKEVLMFFLARVGSLVIDMGIMISLIEIIRLDDWIAKLLTNIVVIILNYAISKLIIFRE